MGVRTDCRHYESRTYSSGEAVRKCALDLAPEAPWRCPVDCPRYERRKTDRDGSPLVVLSLFRHRSFVVGLGVGLSFFTVLAPFLVLLAEYLQSGLDLSPRAAGLRFLPFAIGFLTASLASARLAPHRASWAFAFGRSQEHPGCGGAAGVLRQFWDRLLGIGGPLCYHVAMPGSSTAITAIRAHRSPPTNCGNGIGLAYLRIA